ncbi:Holliday junction resolvase RuvX [Acidimicrobiia bacterium]|nr:Holliday junction resolvase RuvX [Acidimicrobiia bacterium]
MNVLGLDYGERYIGCAVSTVKSNTPFALKIIDTKVSDVDVTIQKIIDDYKIRSIAIGYPIGLNNHETRMSKLVDEFINNTLEPKFNLKVSRVDERMTSTIITGSNKDRIDDISALQILETYLANV